MFNLEVAHDTNEVHHAMANMTGIAEILPDGVGRRIHWVYAHGRLEKDMNTDLFSVNLNGATVEDGMKATYKGKPVVLHLFRDRSHGMLTGIATYEDDIEACTYGRSLVKERPSVF